MKKILLLLTSITVILTLGACGDNKKETEEKANQTEKESKPNRKRKRLFSNNHFHQRF